MERHIEFKGRMGRYDVPSFIWGENETLCITFGLNKNVLGRYIYVVKCGKSTAIDYLRNDMKITIPAEFIKRGNFEPLYISIELRTMAGDKVIIPADAKLGGFMIEPLVIDKATASTTAIAWCQDLETKYAELSADLQAIKTKLAQYEDEGVPLLAETENEE